MKRLISIALCNLILLSVVKPQQSDVYKEQHLNYFIEGIENPEDLIKIPGTNWVIVSSMATTTTSSGKLYSINILSKKVVLLFDINNKKDHNSYNLTRFAPHGITIRKIHKGQYQLLVINHGSREAVEIFTIEISNEQIGLAWVDSINFPKNVWANGLVADSSGAIYATSMYDPQDSTFKEKFNKKTPTGGVWKWNSSIGWRLFNKIGLSGANGIALSPDGHYVYVSEWAGRRIHRFSTVDPSDAISVVTDFLPDNIRWSEQGNLIVTGQKATPSELFAPKSSLSKAILFRVILLSPKTMIQQRIIDAGDTNFQKATVTIDTGNSYWIGCVDDNKIAVYSKQ